MWKKHLIFFSIFFACLCLSINLFARPQYIEFIFDSSKSMREPAEKVLRMGTERKIDVAVRVFNQMIDDLAKLESKDLYVGLRVFGHNIEETSAYESCQDCVLEMPLELLDAEKAEQMKQIIKSLEPKGLTPISLAIKRAADDFPDLKDVDRKIILISDGRETCGGDPVANAGILLKEKDARSYVVGFGVSKAEEEQLRKIAQAGGGEYLHAKDSAQFQEAIETVREKVIEKPLEIESQKVKFTVKYGTLKVQAPDWFGMDYWWVTKPGEDHKQAVQQGRGEVKEIQLKAGTYEFHCQQHRYNYEWKLQQEGFVFSPVVIEAGKDTLLKIPDQGLMIKKAKDVEAYRVSIHEYSQQSSKYKTLLWSWAPKEEPLMIYLQEGEYKVYIGIHANGGQFLPDVYPVKKDTINEILLDTAITLVLNRQMTEKIQYWKLKNLKTGEISKFFPSHINTPMFISEGEYSLWVTMYGESKDREIVEKIIIKPHINNKVEVEFDF